jgi:hypothetical protein
LKGTVGWQYIGELHPNRGVMVNLSCLLSVTEIDSRAFWAGEIVCNIKVKDRDKEKMEVAVMLA